MLFFYLLTILSILLRLAEFTMLTFYFYCNIMVVNVAQAATIAKLGLGICHTNILAELYFNLRALEVEVIQGDNTGRKQNIQKQAKMTNTIFVIFFVFVVAVQALISYDKRISIRIEYGS